MQNKDYPRLLDCPFCGGIGTLWSIDQCDTVYAVCQNCGARTVDYKYAEEAISAWNRRAQPANEPLTMEQLRNMDGEPVWCVDCLGNQCWALVNVADDECIDKETGAWCMGLCGGNETDVEGVVKMENKREKVMSAIAPICEAFRITDYDYIVKETGQRETLRLYETMIGCTDNSVDAVIDEVIGWLFVNLYCKNRHIGAFRTQTLNAVRRYWIKS